MEARKTQSYIIHEGRNVGPFSDADLRRFIAEGKLTEDAMLWREGYAEPLKVGSVTELHTPPSTVPSNPFLHAMPTQPVAPHQPAASVELCSAPSSDGLSIFLRVVAALGLLIVGEMLVVQIYRFRDEITAQANEAKKEQTKLAEDTIAESLEMYRVHNYQYPTTKQGLNALLSSPGKSKTWRGPYIEVEKLRDPWRSEFDYGSDGHTFTIISAGPDKRFGTDDDIDSTGGGAMNGVVVSAESNAAPTSPSEKGAIAAPANVDVKTFLANPGRYSGQEIALVGFVVLRGSLIMVHAQENSFETVAVRSQDVDRESMDVLLQPPCNVGCDAVVYGIADDQTLDGRSVTIIGSQGAD